MNYHVSKPQFIFRCTNNYNSGTAVNLGPNESVGNAWIPYPLPLDSLASRPFGPTRAALVTNYLTGWPVYYQLPIHTMI